MGVLFQFQSVNKKATAANVRQFFKKDVEKLEYLSGNSLSGLYHSPSFDSVPSGGNHLNNTEKQVIDAVDARKELGLVIQAMNECTPLSKKILVYRYIKDLPMFQIEQLIGYGSSQAHVKQQQAWLEFANHYAEHGRDLRIMSKREIEQ